MNGPVVRWGQGSSREEIRGFLCLCQQDEWPAVVKSFLRDVPREVCERALSLGEFISFCALTTCSPDANNCGRWSEGNKSAGMRTAAAMTCLLGVLVAALCRDAADRSHRPIGSARSAGRAAPTTVTNAEEATCEARFASRHKVAEAQEMPFLM